ncbi:response regulator [Methanocalculus taiwanensis]|uniref:Response regulator n=1 Tax=Methanocalculus taiwanensis TaxID=106207 RepID=A0ABD4TFQ4_9EURY|nr:response regulator [Methanocalculus taiwanensis]MCQ1537481.1 response regulator [Methanocalculus taiwanensis]
MTTVLIADDNPQNLYLLEAILKGYGYTPITAINGREALETAVKSPPDLIITDILMPEMDGFELCRRWKADTELQQIPFIFYTATYTDPRDEQFALSLGAERFVTKPQKPDILIAIVREVLEEAGKEKPPQAEKTFEEEMELLREYNEVLFRKLQKKVRQLEDEIIRCNRIEADLRESEKFLNSIVEEIPNMIFVKDADELRFVRFNKAGEELLGVSRKDLIGKNDYDFFPKEQAEAFIQKDRDALDTKALVEIPEESILTQKKGERVLHTKKMPILDESGNPAYLLGISEDITERKELEELRRTALIQIEEQIQNLAVLNDSIRNPLAVIIALTSMNEGEVFERISRQAYEIDHIVTLLDEGWLESLKIREFIRKHII